MHQAKSKCSCVRDSTTRVDPVVHAWTRTGHSPSSTQGLPPIRSPPTRTTTMPLVDHPSAAVEILLPAVASRLFCTHVPYQNGDLASCVHRGMIYSTTNDQEQPVISLTMRKSSASFVDRWRGLLDYHALVFQACSVYTCFTRWVEGHAQN